MDWGGCDHRAQRALAADVTDLACDESRAASPVLARMNVWNEEAATFAEHWAPLADPARHAIADALELRAGHARARRRLRQRRLLRAGAGARRERERDRRRAGDARDRARARARGRPARRRDGRAAVGGRDLRRGDRLQQPAVRGRSGGDAARVGARLRPARSRSASGARARTSRSTSSSPRCASWPSAPEPPARVLRAARRGRSRTPGSSCSRTRRSRVPFEVPDEERLLAAFLFDARAYGAEETAAREVILAAAAPSGAATAPTASRTRSATCSARRRGPDSSMA